MQITFKTAQYSVIVEHEGYTEFRPNLDYGEVHRLLEHYPEAVFTIFPAQAEISLQQFESKDEQVEKFLNELANSRTGDDPQAG